MLSYITEIRVRYADTDQMQIVYNGKYFEYFEVGRTEMLRSIGLPYNQIEKQGFMLPVLETHIQFKNSACYDDLLLVKSFVKEIPSLKIHIEYEIRKMGEDRLIASGYTSHAFLNKGNRKVVRPPQFFLEKIKEFYD
jgi:acyl-CoA thioester hydrolase